MAYTPPKCSRLWYLILVSGILGCSVLGCGILGFCWALAAPPPVLPGAGPDLEILEALIKLYFWGVGEQRTDDRR